MCKFENPRFNLIFWYTIKEHDIRTCKNEDIMKRASRSLKRTTSRWLFTLTQTCMYQRINDHAIKMLVQQKFYLNFEGGFIILP
jgi:hypothetical protein